MIALNIASIEPLVFHVRQSGQAGNLLDDGVFDFLLRLAWAGSIALSHLAPPCSSHSVLRLRKGGPPAVRTPSRMQGVWGLTGKRKKEFEESKLLHERSVAVMHAVISTGGISVYEQPPASLAWLELKIQQMFRALLLNMIQTPACRWGSDFAKRWAFASNCSGFKELGGTCPHAPGAHRSIRGTRDNGGFVSRQTAACPQALAEASAKIVQANLGKNRVPRAHADVPPQQPYCWTPDLRAFPRPKRGR